MMQPANFKAMMFTSTFGLFFGLVGVTLGLCNAGLPRWAVLVGICITAVVTTTAGVMQISELYSRRDE